MIKFLLFLPFVVSLLLPDEKRALEALYNSTQGDAWKEDCRNDWDFDGAHDPCVEEWRGVSCAPSGNDCATANCTIINLSLVGCGLAGTLPQQLENLISLNMFDVSNNAIGGSLPNVFAAMTSMFQLSIGDNEFTGQLPQLSSSLASFFLSRNYVSGTIPSYVSLATSLLVIDARHNLIHGTLPPEVVTLPNLVELSLGDNFITGTLPAFTFDSRKLQTLRMGANLLTGSLPSTLSILTKVVTFEFHDNLLTGSLSSAATLSRVNTLDLSNNFFISSLPFTLSGLTRLGQLYLSHNMLTSSVPETFSALTSINYFFMDSNFITGPFPSYVLLYPSLFTINVSSNYLTGPLDFPSTRMPLHGVYLDHNALSGTIPELFNECPYMGDLDLSYNYMSGSIPWGIADPLVMQKFAISSNLLTGSLSSKLLTNASSCQYFYCQDNFLTGSMPAFFGDDKALLQIFLSDNFFSGTIPQALTLPPSFQTLLLQGNIMHGQPGEAFTNSTSSVVVIDLSNNRFTGSIPDEFFTLPRLRWISLIRNCFSGPIPESICAAENLNVLLLDGLRSGFRCQHDAWQPFLSTGQAYITSAIPGGIPECLWTMPTLRMLHLSGNRLTGTLPNNLEDILIRDLSLSHNRLSGTIPKAFQRSNYSYLDLSNNRFTGELFSQNEWNNNAPMTTDVTKYTTKLYTNRLSGDVPKSFESMHRVNMLLGNIFACKNLPSADANGDTYVCESSALNNSLYIYAVLGGLWLFPVLLTWFLLRRKDAGLSMSRLYTLAKNIQFWYLTSRRGDDTGTSSVPKKSYQLNMFLWMMRYMRQLAWMLGGCIVVLLVCISCMKSFVPGVATHSHEYLWHYSGAYMSGKVAGVMFIVALFILFLILILMTRHITYSKHGTRSHSDSVSDRDRTVEVQSPLARVRSMQPSTLSPQSGDLNSKSIFTLFSSRMPSSASTSHTERTSVFSVPSIGPPDAKSVKSKVFIISLVLLNALIVILVKGCYVYYLLTASITPSTKYTLQFFMSLFDVIWNNMFISSAVRWFPQLVRSKIRIKINVFLLLFNTIVAPVVATVLTDGNCFLNLFEPEHDIKTYDSYVYCKSISFSTDTCVSYGALTLTTAYSPPFIYNYQCSSAVVSNFVPVFIVSYALLAFVLPLMYIALMVTSSLSTEQDMLQKVFAGILFPTIPSSKYVPRKFFHPGVLTANLINHIVLLLTFGVMSPPLAMTICITVSINTLFWQTIIGRYMWIRSQQRLKSENGDGTTLADTTYLVTLEKVCEGVWQGPLKSVWFVIDTSCVFFAFLLVDVVGDGSGWLYAIIHFSVPMVSIPFLLRIIFRSNLSLHRMEDFVKWQEDVSRESVIVNINEIHALSNHETNDDVTRYSQRYVNASDEFTRSVELSTSF